MKKFTLILLLSSLIALFGCSSGKVEDKSKDSSDRPDVKIYKLEYEGHSYLVVRFPQNSHANSMCHDENCHCRAK